MEVTESRKGQTAYATITRVYSPSRGSSAFAYAQTAQAQPLPKPLPEERSRLEAQPRVKPRQAKSRQLAMGTKVSLVFSMVVLTVALLVVVFRYHTISQRYSVVNTTKSNIQEAERRISELNVSLENAVTIQDAKEAAQRFGMTYPDADQYVRAGDVLVIPGAGSAADPKVAGDGDGEEQPDNQNEPGTSEPETPEQETPEQETPEPDTPLNNNGAGTS